MDVKDIKYNSCETFDETIENKVFRFDNFLKEHDLKVELSDGVTVGNLKQVGFKSEDLNEKLTRSRLFDKINNGELKVRVICEDDSVIQENANATSGCESISKFKTNSYGPLLKSVPLLNKQRRNLSKQRFDCCFNNNVLTVVNTDCIKFMCKLCGLEYSHKGDLKRHVEATHLKLKPFKCFYCGFSSSRKSSVKKHIISNHMKNRLFGCNYCSYKGGSKYRLEYHRKTVHRSLYNQRTVYHCAYCSNWVTNHKDSVKRHIVKSHLDLFTTNFQSASGSFTNSNDKLKLTNRKQYKNVCPHCNFSSKSSYKLQDHIYGRHKFVKPFKCDLCVFACSYREGLRRHKSRLHFQKLQCKECNLLFSSKILLTEHNTKRHFVSLSDRECMYFCSYCCQSYYSKNNLLNHIRLCHKSKF